MKLLILVVALVGLASARLSASQLQSAYQQAKAKYMSAVPTVSGTDDSARFAAFSINANAIDDHNAGDSNWVAVVNKFALETDPEKQLSLGLNVSDVLEEQRRSLRVRRRATPLTVEERSLDVDYTSYLPPIKDQGYCGSCWAFGATVPLEYQVNRHRTPGTDTMRSLSEQQYLDCVYEGDGDGCNGGWPATCWTWTKMNGNMIANEADMPYLGYDGTCRTNTHSAISGFSVNSNQYLYSGDSAMLEAVNDASIGVISVAIGVVNSFYSYGSGVYSNEATEDCSGINHAVDVVGYGTLNGEGYWRCRNSWGNWGDAGYINMKRGLNGDNVNMCSISSYGHYPRVSGSDDGSNDGNDDNSDNSDDNNDDGSSDDEPGACWESDMGEFDTSTIIGETSFTNYGLCGSMCGATSGCKAAVVSGDDSSTGRVCFLLSTEDVSYKAGWMTAKASCDGSDNDNNDDSDDRDDQETCEWKKITDVKFKGALTGLDYTLADCKLACPETSKCKGCSCKNDTKCRMNKKTNTKNNSKYDAYEMSCPGRK